jgi:hypothetical protein
MRMGWACQPARLMKAILVSMNVDAGDTVTVLGQPGKEGIEGRIQ